MPFRPDPEEGEELFSKIPRRPPRGSEPKLEPEPEEEAEDGGENPAEEFKQRGGGASPWSEEFERERPRGRERAPAAPEGLVPELYEILVPDPELRDPHGRYMAMFEQLPYRPLPRRGMVRQEPPARGDWGPETPRVPSRGPAPTPAPGPSPRARMRTGPPVVDPAMWFDMNAVWTGVRQRRADPRFQPGTPVGVIQIAPARPDEASRAQDLIRFFRIPKGSVSNFSGKQLWDMLHEFMDELSYGMNQTKPNDIPGEVGFQAGRDGSFWLGYME
jgi:hypothetical protein